MREIIDINDPLFDKIPIDDRMLVLNNKIELSLRMYALLSFNILPS